MTSMALLSPLARACFTLWALLLCIAALINAWLALGKKRYPFTALGVLLLAPSYLSWQILFDLSLLGKTGAISPLTQALCNLAWPWWLVFFTVLSLADAFLLVYNIHYERTFITPASIKAYLDQIPCGVCCWRGSGRVLFANDCMNRLCVSLTGEPLLNGNQFRDAVADGIRTADGRMWRFSCRELTIRGERLFDMIASDVTTEYAKTQALEKDRAELSRINRELREYTLGIDEAVRHQEILQAKVNIHNEMNRLMLSTTAAESEDAPALDKIFSLWEQNALLLCMEADGPADQKAEARVEELAKTLKIRLVWRSGVPPELTEEQRVLFFTAAEEAVTNAVKHAQASELSISFSQDEQNLTCRFANDGTVRRESVTFSGGLANLSRLAEQQGANLSFEAGDRFTLSLSFPVKTSRTADAQGQTPAVE